MAFEHVPNRSLSSAIHWPQAQSVVRTKLEALHPEVAGRYVSWAVVMAPAHELTTAGLEGGLCGMNVLPGVTLPPLSHDGKDKLGLIYGSSGRRHANSARLQAEHELVDYAMVLDPTWLDRYASFLDEWVVAAPRLIEPKPYPWMIGTEDGEIQMFELDRSGYKKQLSMLKNIINPRRGGSKERDGERRLGFPAGATLGWLEFAPLRQVSLTWHSLTSSGVAPLSTQLGVPPMWLALESWVDGLAAHIKEVQDGGRHEIWLECDYAPLEYILFCLLEARLPAGQLCMGAFRAAHMDKWMYGYQPVGRWLSFLARASQWGQEPSSSPPVWCHYLRRQAGSAGRGWGLEVVTMGAAASRSTHERGDESAQMVPGR